MNTRSYAFPQVWPRLAFTSGTLEALKWFAFACMVVDHANRILTGYTLGPVAEMVGRLAFPIFAVVFGFNLARPKADARGIAWRLFCWGLLATPVYAIAFRSFWPANILFTLAAAALLVHAWRDGGFLPVGADRRKVWRLVAPLGLLVDYLWPGLGLVLGAWWYAREPGPRPALLVGLSLAGVSLLVGNAWAFLAVPLLLAARHVDVAVPRLRTAFLAGYVLHLAALLALRSLVD